MLHLALVLSAALAQTGGIRLADEGTLLGPVVKIDCVGAGVTCTRSSSTVTGTITVTGGGGGSANVVEAEVDFGSSGSDTAEVIVTGAAWVTATSKIVCAATLLATADRAEGAEDALIEGLRAAVHSRVNGTGFTIVAAPAMGRAIGKFKIHCSGG